MLKGLVETIKGLQQWIMRVDIINNVGIAIININKPPIFDGLYHPSMVIRGMVYYCYTNINVNENMTITTGVITINHLSLAPQNAPLRLSPNWAANAGAQLLGKRPKPPVFFGCQLEQGPRQVAVIAPTFPLIMVL